jgi:hypothetical protein
LLIGVPVGGLLLYGALSNLGDFSTAEGQTWPIRDAALLSLTLGAAHLLWSCSYEASTLLFWAIKCRALRKELIE